MNYPFFAETLGEISFSCLIWTISVITLAFFLAFIFNLYYFCHISVRMVLLKQTKKNGKIELYLGLLSTFIKIEIQFQGTESILL